MYVLGMLNLTLLNWTVVAMACKMTTKWSSMVTTLIATIFVTKRLQLLHYQPPSEQCGHKEVCDYCFGRNKAAGADGLFGLKWSQIVASYSVTEA